MIKKKKIFVILGVISVLVYRSISASCFSDHLRFLSNLACQKTLIINFFMQNLSLLRPPVAELWFFFKVFASRPFSLRPRNFKLL